MTEDDDLRKRISDWLDRVEPLVEQLVNAILYQKVANPDTHKLGFTPANPETARRARMGKWARKAGLTIEEFERQYPGLDRWPPPPDWML